MNRERFFSRYYASEDAIHRPFTPLSLGYNNYRPCDVFPLGEHPVSHIPHKGRGRLLNSLTIVHVLRGQGTFRSDLCPETTLPAGTILFVHPNVRHLYHFAPRVGWDDEWLELRVEDVRDLPEFQLVDPRAPFRTLPSQSSLTILFRRLFDLAIAEPGCGLRLASAAYGILAEALATWCRCEHSENATAAVEQLRALIASNLGGRRTIEDLSRDCGMSASRLRTAFGATFHLSPKQYQLELRINRAKELLEITDLPVSTIAEQTGFDSIYAFSRQFKRTVGTSPLSFRNR